MPCQRGDDPVPCSSKTKHQDRVWVFCWQRKTCCPRSSCNLCAISWKKTPKEAEAAPLSLQSWLIVSTQEIKNCSAPRTNYQQATKLLDSFLNCDYHHKARIQSSVANWNSRGMCGKKLVRVATREALTKRPWAGCSTAAGPVSLPGRRHRSPARHHSSATCAQPRRVWLRETQRVRCKQEKPILAGLKRSKKKKSHQTTLGLHHPRLKPIEEVFGKVKYHCKNTCPPSLWLRTSLTLQCMWPEMKLLTHRCGPRGHIKLLRSPEVTGQ